MKLFSWTSALATGHKFIDDDHRVLISRVNGVLNSISKSQTSEQIAVALNELIEFSRAHFAREEAEMARINYSEAALHQQEHAQLLLQIIELHTQLAARESIDTMGLYTFLTRWVKDHIVKFDMKFAAALEAAH